ncbi:MAG: chitobiase/beta-hexosaminidase C-terminal domain-containing protein [Bacteroidales bacterium]|nr:chitobiase/beta-hexosaminidase C-terminal domain-containing protein [Bacteroidales bacterium]
MKHSNRSILYSWAINVAAIFFFVFASGSAFGSTVSKPSFNPDGGNFTSAVAVTISTSTAGATIRYTTNGSNPSQTNGTIYTGPVTLDATCTLKAIAYLVGWTDSDIKYKDFIFEVMKPTFNPDGGSFLLPPIVTIATTTPGATIRYTLNNSTPSQTNGIVYTGPVTINNSLTLRAIAYKTGYTDSDIKYKDFGLPQVVKPTFNPDGGTFAYAPSVTIATTTSGTTIRYTTDGSEPSQTNGTLYTGPITLDNSCRLKAMAYKLGMDDSDIKYKDFTITKVSAPTMTPAPGTYNSPQVVTLASSTTGASIRYTLDGSTPTSTTGTLYTIPISVGSNLTMKAIAYKSGMTNSDVTSGAYNIRCAAPVFSPLPGFFSTPPSVSLSSSTSGATIRYTTNGNTPSPTNGTIYSGPFTVASTATVKAIAYKTGNFDSDISSGLYTIQLPAVAAPEFSPASGTFTSSQNITITSATPGANIRYTTNGSIPSSTSGIIYSVPVQISTSGTIRAIAYKSGMLDSEVSLAIYSFQAADSDGDGVIDIEDDYPADPLRAFNTYYPATGNGTLAFEDLWPSQGDYDFNDLVMNYKFKIVTNSQNKVVEFSSDFHVIAVGAGLKNGFGFQMDGITPDKITSVSGKSITGNYISFNANGTESNQAKAVIIVLDNTENVLHRAGGSMFNTVNNGFHGTSDTISISVVFATPVTMAAFGTPPFNPFLIKGQDRSSEIHLADKIPTSLANTAIFGTFDDSSNPATGRYYKTASNLPWAINIPEAFAYPYEKTQILEGHLHFAEWAESSGTLFPDWYQNKTGYRDNSKIYQ